MFRSSKSIMAKIIGDKLFQSNFDKRLPDFVFFLSYLITTVNKLFLVAI